MSDRARIAGHTIRIIFGVSGFGFNNRIYHRISAKDIQDIVRGKNLATVTYTGCEICEIQSIASKCAERGNGICVSVGQ